MNRNELVAAVAEASGISKANAASAIDALCDVILGAAIAEDSVTLSLGKFTGKMRDARTARNPQTGGTVEVPAGIKLAFKESKTVKDTIKAAAAAAAANKGKKKTAPAKAAAKPVSKAAPAKAAPAKPAKAAPAKVAPAKAKKRL